MTGPLRTDWVDGVQDDPIHADDYNAHTVLTNQHDVQIGTLTTAVEHLQPLDPDLTAIAGLAPADNAFIVRKGGVWVARLTDQVKSDLDIQTADVEGLDDALTARQLTSAKNAADGYAGLGSDGKIPVTLLPTTGTGGGTVSVGKFAIRPASSPDSLGAIYLCTDNGNTYRDNGTTWELINVAGTGLAGAEPPSAGWTLSTMGSATIAADKGGRLLTMPSAASDNWRYERRTLSPTSNYTITGHIEPTPAALAVDNFYSGLILGDGTKFWSFGLFSLGSTVSVFATGWNMLVRKWANATTLSAEAANLTPAKLGCRPNWLRIVDNGTNLTFQYSVNGIDWTTVFVEARTTFLTASVYGWGGNNNTGSAGTVRLSSLSVA